MLKALLLPREDQEVAERPPAGIDFGADVARDGRRFLAPLDRDAVRDGRRACGCPARAGSVVRMRLQRREHRPCGVAAAGNRSLNTPFAQSQRPGTDRKFVVSVTMPGLVRAAERARTSL